MNDQKRDEQDTTLLRRRVGADGFLQAERRVEMTQHLPEGDEGVDSWPVFDP